ncbi:glycoside hydrolase family 15 protein [Halosimplex sp. J119]
MQDPQYQPLSEYGVVGNMETCALVDRSGSIDWCCVPHMESPSVFAAMLDHERGGHFSVSPTDSSQAAQTYVDGTNVLRTVFHTATGDAQLVDFMPYLGPGHEGSMPDVIYRKATCTDGSIRLSVGFEPRFDYAREVPEFAQTGHGVVARGATDELFLSGPTEFAVESGRATATVTLTAGETAWFALRYGRDGPHERPRFERHLDRTVDAWRRWLREGGEQAAVIDDGRWQALVDRSALALKLLIHRPTDAIAAAPTTSLPESIGGTRNWDYRYSWIRDAAFTVQALYKLGHVREAKAYFSWLLSKVYDDPESIRPLYGLHGGVDADERTLSHLEGYRGSAPVRVGNAAGAQRQLDVYGELVLALYETARFGATITESNWAALREIIEHVAAVWDQPDSGIWEVRTEPRHFVHSKVMCWAALDRGVKIIERTGFDGPLDRWRRTREDVRAAILDRGYSAATGTFVQTFETDEALDATGLLLPVVGFLPAEDPRVQRTIDAIRDQLTTDQGLVYRYHSDDGLPGGEGTFVLCSFWLVDALALSGRIAEAEALFDSVLGHVSPLGLLAEEIAAETGALLGNFPQAFSHIGLINSAIYLDRAKRDRQIGPEPLGAENAADGPVPRTQ